MRGGGGHEAPACGGRLPILALARRLYAYGEQRDYFDHRNCIGKKYRLLFFNFPFLPLYVPFSGQCQTSLLRIVKPGFVRYGNKNHPSGLACVLSNAGASRKTMFVGRHHAGEQWTDLLGWNQEVIFIDSSGWATFPVSTRSVSVWVSAAADDRDRFRLL